MCSSTRRSKVQHYLKKKNTKRSNEQRKVWVGKHYCRYISHHIQTIKINVPLTFPIRSGALNKISDRYWWKRWIYEDMIGTRTQRPSVFVWYHRHYELRRMLWRMRRIWDNRCCSRMAFSFVNEDCDSFFYTKGGRYGIRFGISSCCWCCRNRLRLKCSISFVDSKIKNNESMLAPRDNRRTRPVRTQLKTISFLLSVSQWVYCW